MPKGIRGNGGYPEIHEPHRFVNEVEVVVKTLAGGWPHIGLVSTLVVPWFVGVTHLHGRDHMNQTGMVSTGLENLSHQVFLPDMGLGNVLNRHSGLMCQLLGLLANPFA